ncbi:MAG: hypothetical protein ACLRXC_00530 [[Clostridium] leptum]
MIAFPKLTEQELLDRIRIPSEGKLNIFLDTDTYNEIDDQFAILYAMLSPERLCLKGISAALFLTTAVLLLPTAWKKATGNFKNHGFSGKGSGRLVFADAEPLADEEVPGKALPATLSLPKP